VVALDTCYGRDKLNEFIPITDISLQQCLSYAHSIILKFARGSIVTLLLDLDSYICILPLDATPKYGAGGCGSCPPLCCMPPLQTGYPAHEAQVLVRQTVQSQRISSSGATL
jgi:hypothetical protein